MMRMPYEFAKEMMDMFVILSIYANGQCPTTLEEIAASEEYAREMFMDAAQAWETKNNKWVIVPPESEDPEDKDPCLDDEEEECDCGCGCCCEDEEHDCECHEEAPAATIDNPNFNEEQFQKTISDFLNMLFTPSGLKS